MAHPEELYVVYEDRQINDLVRFCTSSVQNTLLTVDPTFDFGKFAVTPVTQYTSFQLVSTRSYSDR